MFPILTSLMRHRIGKTGDNGDLRARRPAATPKKRPRAGCPGGACRLMPAFPVRAFEAASSLTSSPNNIATGSLDVTHSRSRSQRRSIHPPASRIISRAGSAAADAGDPPQRHGFEIRRQQDFGRDDQGVPRGRRAWRGRLPTRARDRRATNRRSRRRAVAPDERGPHLSYRGRAGPGRTGPDAQRAPQGRARLCAVSRGANPTTRRAGSGQCRQAVGGACAACHAGERRAGSARYRAPDADHRGGLCRARGRQRRCRAH